MESGLRSEMQEKSDLEGGRAQIAVDLPLGGPGEIGTGLDLHDDPVVHEHVEALGRERLPFVRDLDADFPAHAMSARAQLPFHRLDVHALQEPVSEDVVDLVERADDRVREIRFEKLGHAHSLLRTPLEGGIESVPVPSLGRTGHSVHV